MVEDFDPFGNDSGALDAPPKLQKRSVSVKPPPSALKSYGEGLAAYCLSGTPTIAPKYADDGNILNDDQIKTIQAKAEKV